MKASDCYVIAEVVARRRMEYRGVVATIAQLAEFCVMIFKDHGPPHVHVVKGGTESVIDLLPLAIRDNYRMSRADLRRAVDIVFEIRRYSFRRGDRCMALGNVEFERQAAAATFRGNQRLKVHPVAEAVRYAQKSKKIVIDLSNRRTLLVDPTLVEGLSGASAAKISDARILGPGTTIDWPKLDVQLSVAGLLGGNSGTAAWMSRKNKPST